MILKHPSRVRQTTKVARALAITISMLALAASLHAQTYSVLHNFGGGTSGSYPYCGLTMDRVGNFYGTTYEGGSNGQGMVFKLSKPTVAGSSRPSIPSAAATTGPFPMRE